MVFAMRFALPKTCRVKTSTLPTVERGTKTMSKRESGMSASSFPLVMARSNATRVTRTFRAPSR